MRFDKNMKLNKRTEHPENNTLVFAVNNETSDGFFSYKHSSGFVGLVLFEDGKWYSMPLKVEVSEDNDFQWVSFED